VLGDVFAVLSGVGQGGVCSVCWWFSFSVERLRLWYSCWIAICRLRSLCWWHCVTFYILWWPAETSICAAYGDTWDIQFHPLNSHTITFGGPNPCQCQIAIEDRPIPWVSKVKYLGVYFCCNSGDTDVTDVCRKFYGHLNSILSVVGRCANEMAAVHLINTYCLPILTFACMSILMTEFNRQ